MACRVRGVSIWGPGLPGWTASRPILAGEQPYTSAPTEPPPVPMLSATERRRAGLMVRLALAVAHQAAEMSGFPPESLPVIFGSACADGAILGSILTTLSGPDHQLSPTLFHNSVHNAPAGYWTICTKSHQPVTSLGADAATFPAALLSGIAQVSAEATPVLICIYDVPLPAPLLATRPSEATFGFALVLAPDQGEGTRLCLGFSGAPSAEAWQPRADPLAGLSRDNPATRGLRLLEALAREETTRMTVPYLDGQLTIDVAAC